MHSGYHEDFPVQLKVSRSHWHHKNIGYMVYKNMGNGGYEEPMMQSRFQSQNQENCGGRSRSNGRSAKLYQQSHVKYDCLSSFRCYEEIRTLPQKCWQSSSSLPPRSGYPNDFPRCSIQNPSISLHRDDLDRYANFLLMGEGVRSTLTTAPIGHNQFDTDNQIQVEEPVGIECIGSFDIDGDNVKFWFGIEDNRPILNYVRDGEKEYKLFDDQPHPLLKGLLGTREMKLTNSPYNSEGLMDDMSNQIKMGFARQHHHTLEAENKNGVHGGFPLEHALPYEDPNDVQRHMDVLNWILRLDSRMVPVDIDELFHVFYDCTMDAKPLVAARQLYLKGWRFHILAKTWITPVVTNDGQVSTTDEKGDWRSGVYKAFNSEAWTYEDKFFIVRKGILEDIQPEISGMKDDDLYFPRSLN